MTVWLALDTSDPEGIAILGVMNTRDAAKRCAEADHAKNRPDEHLDWEDGDGMCWASAAGVFPRYCLDEREVES